MTVSISRTFDSFEAFNSFSHGWDAEFRVTTSDDYRATIKHVVAEGILVNSAGFTRATLQRGSTPSGMRTLALPRQIGGPTSWFNHDIDEHSLMLFPDTRELLSVASTHMHVDTLSVADSLFERQLQEVTVADSSALRDGQVTRLAPEQRRRLLHSLQTLELFCDMQSGREGHRELESYLVEELVYQFVRLALDTGEGGRRLPVYAAARTTRRAISFILPRLRTPLTVAEVCAVSGIGRRSLEMSFQRYLGMSPKRFIKQMRFSLCREELLRTPEGKVSDIALRWGFWHMGQFGRDYKALFGELPSHTLKRCASYTACRKGPSTHRRRPSGAAQAPQIPTPHLVR